jgi:hypothetical protein
MHLRFTSRVRRATVATVACSLLSFASDKNDKQKSAASQSVDSGSFSILVKGQHVMTEAFNIRQENGNSRVKAELKEAGSGQTVQKSDMELTASGELLHYEWSQSSPTVSSLTVVPNNDFLLEKIITATNSKPAEQPFLMPSTTAILDNNFFIHREVLGWRYLAAACHLKSGSQQCSKEAADFGVLVPQDHGSARVRMELVGSEKVTIHGAEKDLLRLNLTGEGFEWAIWVDDHDQFKLMRVSIPADNTEVVRD